MLRDAAAYQISRSSFLSRATVALDVAGNEVRKLRRLERASPVARHRQHLLAAHALLQPEVDGGAAARRPDPQWTSTRPGMPDISRRKSSTAALAAVGSRSENGRCR